MKKFLMFIAVVSCFTASYAYEKGTMYLAPVLGYHFFDDDHNLDDKVEGGLRFGKFLNDHYSLEAEADYTNTDKDNGGSTDATTLSLNALYHFDYSKYFKPYVFLGVGGMFYDDSHAGILGGVGANYPVKDNLSIDLRLKDMFMTDSRNDIVPSLALNYYFGKPAKTAPVVEKKAEPAPVVKEEPVVTQKTQPAPVVETKKVADTDGDGVADDADKCAATPMGVKVDAVGCPLDTDGDGVYDYLDKCPGTAKGVKVDSKGCPLDTDGDGVVDSADKCPNTPKGAAVNADGCPLDSDGDGVFDYLDKCPGTPKGYKVNADGCFVSVTLLINFKTASNKILAGYTDEIKTFADFLNANPTLKVEIQGHTDNKGSAEYNKKLSQRRADAVVKELTTTYKVDGSRLTSVGYGEDMPIAPNDTPENMYKNRRIESVVK